jgi:hypothetical protein
MSTSDLNPTGTPEPVSGTTAQAADGSTAQDGGSAQDVEEIRRELEEARRKNEQLLSEKSAVEAARRDYEARNATDQRATAQNPLGQSIAYLQELAAQGDQYAQAQLQISMALAQQARDEAQFARMSADEEKRAREYYGSGDFRSPAVALKAANGDLWETERSKRERENAEIAAAKRAREEGVVNTAPRGVPASVVTNRKLKYTEYNKMLESAPSDDARRKIMTEHGDNLDFGI